jgi:hypothetical protein
MVQEVASQVSLEPYLETGFWPSVNNSMKLRVLLSLIIFVASIAIMCKSRWARGLLICASLGMTILGGFEAYWFHLHAAHVWDELLRDYQVCYLNTLDYVDEGLVSVVDRVVRPKASVIRIGVFAYFVMATALWQIIALLTSLSRPIARPSIVKETTA